MNPPSMIFRAAKIERANADSRTLELSFASAEPVDRGGFVEVLDMRQLDLSRLNTVAPLLRN
ncbi:MAG: hypothetical protein J0L84_20145, partial [Verrucomicrobia bacterium]|nr:hypothetical protein [Verrucomicrobiota bacterium]